MQLRLMGLGTISFISDLGCNSQNTRSTRLTVVRGLPFSSESACFYSDITRSSSMIYFRLKTGSTVAIPAWF